MATGNGGDERPVSSGLDPFAVGRPVRLPVAVDDSVGNDGLAAPSTVGGPDPPRPAANKQMRTPAVGPRSRLPSQRLDLDTLGVRQHALAGLGMPAGPDLDPRPV